MTLEQAFAYHTECVLAAFDYQRSLKSAPKTGVEHLRGIADGMVGECIARNISWEQPDGHGCPRLRKALESAKTPR